MVPSPVFISHFYKLGLMDKGLEGVLSLPAKTLQIPNEADEVAPLA